MTTDEAVIEAMARAEGMVAWHGGQHRAPDDWDRGSVLFRSGTVYGAPAGTVWKLGWDHSYGPNDVIGYRRKTAALAALREMEAR